MSVQQRLVTVEEFYEMPDVPGKIFELIDGEVVEVSGPTALHHHIMLMLYKRLDRFAEQRDLGLVQPDGLPFVLRRDPDLVRIPDVSFVARHLVPDEDPPEWFWEGPPTLAVDVVSPNDRPKQVHAKVQGYLKAGTRLVWVLWPRQRSVTVHDAERGVRELDTDATLDGGDVLPGFTVRVSDLFETRQRR